MLVPGFRAIGLYVEPLLKYHLARYQEIHLLHGGAVARDGRAVVFFGPNGAHKTRLILELCRHYGFDFLGDDLIMVAGRQVLPVVEHERILKARFALLTGRANPIRTRLAQVHALLRPAPASCAGLRIATASVPILAIVLDRQVGGGASTPRGASPPGNTGVRDVSCEALWQRINALERMELIKHQARHRQLINWARMLMAYEFGVPGSHIFRYMLLDDRPLPEGMSNIACRHLVLPERFDPAVGAAVNRWIAEALSSSRL
jgi:hypothetical protein